MRELTLRALDMADASEMPLSTGYLLLAMASGQGTAARLLRLRGLTDSRIRVRLREMEPEPREVVESVLDKARQIAEPFRAREPSALHLLVALAGSRDCQAVEIMRESGLDAISIRTQALRCLTGVTEEYVTYSEDFLLKNNEKGEALPLAEQLQFFSTTTPKKSLAAKDPKPAGARSPAPPLSDTRGALAPTVRTKMLIEMGRELERMQRKKRAMQSREIPQPVLDVSSTGAVEAVRSPRRDVPGNLHRVTALVRAKSSLAIRQSVELAPDQYPLLATLGRNLSQEAAAGELDEIVGRVAEMERIADVLNKRRGNSPCLVGPAGVGKTAVVEGLALRMSRSLAPGLLGRIIVELRPTALIAGTSVRGSLAERLQQLKDEVAKSSGKIILFFDEIHALLGSADGVEVVQELKSALARGQLPCIAATTHAEYSKYIDSDPALARRFTPVEIAEPSEAEALEILKGVEPVYRDHHQVTFAEEALLGAVKLSARYLRDRALPDKAIALLDLCGARARRRGENRVSSRDVAAVLARQLDVPVERLSNDDHSRLLNIEGELEKLIVGHGHALRAIGETLRRNAAGFRSGRPIGSFLFLGPTGVGKTETAKALADFLFTGDTSLVRLDMSEFSEAHAVARLIGAPPGYVGHEEGGQLTEAVKRRPYCLVLLDEIEKSHPDVLKVLLQVLDDGRLTDGLGRTVAFENTVVVMTSNLGSDLRVQKRHVGFGAARRTEDVGDLTAPILSAARAALPPELWNRIDEPLVFGPLSLDEVGEIAARMIRHIADQLMGEHGIVLEVRESAFEVLIETGYDPDLGARPMKRSVQRYIEGPIARMVLSLEATRGDKVVVERDGESLSFAVEPEVFESSRLKERKKKSS